MDHEIEVPHYFLCPISLQIMKDPVTAATGITYDRDSIEKWLKTSMEALCPVTKQPLPKDSDLTPNHTLRRLIQAWCVANARHGVDRIPTPKAPISRAHILKIIRGLSVPTLQSASLDQLLVLATSDDHLKDRNMLRQSHAPKAMVSLIIKCHKDRKSSGLEKALRILSAIWSPASQEIKSLVADNYDFMDALTWVVATSQNVDHQGYILANLGILLIKELVKVASPRLVQRLKPEFFKGVVGILKQRGGIASVVGPMKAAIRVLLEVCQYGRNRLRIIEAQAIFELIELEMELSLTLQQPAERKKLSELVFCLMGQLCSCADGRAQFLAHAAGIAVMTKRLLRVSPAVDDRAVHIFALICKFSATNETLQEMLRVGAVSKLCMVLQADCAKYLKDKARDILRMHPNVWNKSPCIQVYLLTRYPTLQF